MRMKGISIRQRKVRLILALGPGRATDLPMADQDLRPMVAPEVPGLMDRREDRHPIWAAPMVPDPEVRRVVPKKGRPDHSRSRCKI